MGTVLYLNKDQIQIISVSNKKGNPLFENKIKVELTPGSIINGVIINRDAIIEALTPYRKLLQNTTVVINSSNIFVKKIVLPNLSKKQLSNIIKSEFSYADDKNMIYDTSIYQRDEQKVLICCAAPMDLISSYVSILNDAKIKLKKIDVIQNAAAKFVKSEKQLENKTFVINVVEGNNLVSVFFENGEYILTNRSAIFPEDAGNSFAEQFIANLSVMIQFNSSEKSKYIIETSYYVGVNDEGLKALSQLSSNMLGDIEIKSICDISDKDPIFEEFFYPYVATINKEDDINLLKRYNERLKQEQVQKENKITKPFFAGFLAVFFVFGTYYFLKVRSYVLEMENSGIKNYISSPSINKILKATLYENDKSKEIENALTEVGEVAKEINKSSSINSSELIQIMGEASKSVTVESLEYNSEKNIITISGIGNDEYSSATFVANLKATPLFSKIEYNGYQTTKDNRYSFTVVCTFKDKAAG